MPRSWMGWTPNHGAFIGLLCLLCATPFSPAYGQGNGVGSATLMQTGKPEARYRSAAEVRARCEHELEIGIRYPLLVRGNPTTKTIALTFDDGPHPKYTQAILAILKQQNVSATFFVVGKMVDLYPELVQQEAAEGHEVANHTYNHLRLPTLSLSGDESELTEGAHAIQRAIGLTPRLYRPPGGEYDDDTIIATKRLGYVMVLWTDDPGDYGNPGERVIEERVLNTVTDGGIILLHDGVEQTINILVDLIHKLKTKHFKFVTCSEMALERGVITRGGPHVIPGPGFTKPKETTGETKSEK